MSKLNKGYQMIIALLVGIASAVLGSIIDVTIVSPILYIVAAVCGVVFAGFMYSFIEKGLDGKW